MALKDWRNVDWKGYDEEKDDEEKDDDESKEDKNDWTNKSCFDVDDSSNNIPNIFHFNFKSFKIFILDYGRPWKVLWFTR